MTTCLFVRALADRVYGKKVTETHMAYSCLTSQAVDVGTHAKNTHTNRHTQNKHSNPGLEKLSDDTAASITAKTFTLLFFNNPFIFLLSFLFILAFIFPLSWGRLSFGDVLTTDGGSGIHTKGKHSQGHSRQDHLFNKNEQI